MTELGKRGQWLLWLWTALGRATVAGVLMIGCATATSDSPEVPDVSGTWVGFISAGGGLLALGGITSGEMRLTLAQHGRGVTGTLTLPGTRATVNGRLYANEFSGSATGEAMQGGGTVRLDATVVGDRMEAVLEFTLVTLRRSQAAR